MTQFEAWQYINRNWFISQWQEIPANIKQVLGLDSRLGMLGGMLVTRKASEYANIFIRNLNDKLNKESR